MWQSSEPLSHPSCCHFQLYNDPEKFDKNKRDEMRTDDLDIRDSDSPPLHKKKRRPASTSTSPERQPTPKRATRRTSSAPPLHRNESAAYDAFRRRKAKKKVESDSDSDVEYLLHHRVKKGVKVADRPLSLESLTSLNQRLAIKEDLYQQRMLLEAEKVSMEKLTSVVVARESTSASIGPLTARRQLL